MAEQCNHISNTSHDLWDQRLTGAGVIAAAGARIAEDPADDKLRELGKVHHEKNTGEDAK